MFPSLGSGVYAVPTTLRMRGLAVEKISNPTMGLRISAPIKLTPIEGDLR